MKKIFLLVLFSAVFASCSPHIAVTVEQALEIYDSGNKEKAKELLMELSRHGDFNADFELAYRYVNDYDDQYRYLRNAAVHGHKEAVELFLDLTLFRSNSLTRTNPKDALYVYKEYLKQRNISSKEKEDFIEFFTKCASVPKLNAEKFCRKYNIDYDEKAEQPGYFIWELAEEASRNGGRFGEPNPELILQLIICGGNVPAEFTSAVDDFYEYYRNNEIHEFKIDDYVTSGYGINFCAQRKQQKLNTLYKERTEKLAEKFTEENKEKLLQTMESYYDFVDEKIWSEEGNDGSGYIAWAYSSADVQKKELLNFLEQVIENQTVNSSEKKIDDLFFKLEELKQNRDKKLAVSSIHGFHFTITLEDEHKIDSLWENYQKNMVCLLETQFGLQTAQEMNKWIHQKRIEDLKTVIELYFDYSSEN